MGIKLFEVKSGSGSISASDFFSLETRLRLTQDFSLVLVLFYMLDALFGFFLTNSLYHTSFGIILCFYIIFLSNTQCPTYSLASQTLMYLASLLLLLIFALGLLFFCLFEEGRERERDVWYINYIYVCVSICIRARINVT